MPTKPSPWLDVNYFYLCLYSQNTLQYEDISSLCGRYIAGNPRWVYIIFSKTLTLVFPPFLFSVAWRLSIVHELNCLIVLITIGSMLGTLAVLLTCALRCAADVDIMTIASKSVYSRLFKMILWWSYFVFAGYSVPKCDGYWTAYYNVGNPSRTGDDDESLAKVRKLHPGVCANPSNIDVRLVHPQLPGEGNDFW